MKKQFIIIVILTCCQYQGMAQRFYDCFSPDDYKSDTLQMEGYSYICDTLLGASIGYYNIENNPEKGVIKYKNGQYLCEDGLEDYLDDVYTFSREKYLLCRTIIDNGFSSEQVSTFKNIKLEVRLFFSTQDGSVTDVYFNMPANSPYCNIPIDVFRAIELLLKENIYVKLGPKADEVTHISFAWRQCPVGPHQEGTNINNIQLITLPNDNSLSTELP